MACSSSWARLGGSACLSDVTGPAPRWRNTGGPWGRPLLRYTLPPRNANPAPTRRLRALSLAQHRWSRTPTPLNPAQENLDGLRVLGSGRLNRLLAGEVPAGCHEIERNDVGAPGEERSLVHGARGRCHRPADRLRDPNRGRLSSIWPTRRRPRHSSSRGRLRVPLVVLPRSWAVPDGDARGGRAASSPRRIEHADG